jgi:hypothetical protein
MRPLRTEMASETFVRLVSRQFVRRSTFTSSRTICLRQTGTFRIKKSSSLISSLSSSLSSLHRLSCRRRVPTPIPHPRCSLPYIRRYTIPLLRPTRAFLLYLEPSQAWSKPWWCRCCCRFRLSSPLCPISPEASRHSSFKSCFLEKRIK